MSGSAKLDSYSEDASVNLETFSPRGCSSLAYGALRGVSNLKLKRSPRAPRYDCTFLHSNVTSLRVSLYLCTPPATLRDLLVYC